MFQQEKKPGSKLIKAQQHEVQIISEEEFKAYEFAPADIYFIEKIVKNIA